MLSRNRGSANPSALGLRMMIRSPDNSIGDYPIGEAN